MATTPIRRRRCTASASVVHLDQYRRVRDAVTLDELRTRMQAALREASALCKQISELEEVAKREGRSHG